MSKAADMLKMIKDWRSMGISKQKDPGDLGSRRVGIEIK